MVVSIEAQKSLNLVLRVKVMVLVNLWTSFLEAKLVRYFRASVVLNGLKRDMHLSYQIRPAIYFFADRNHRK